MNLSSLFISSFFQGWLRYVFDPYFSHRLGSLLFSFLCFFLFFLYRCLGTLRAVTYQSYLIFFMFFFFFFIQKNRQVLKKMKIFKIKEDKRQIKYNFLLINYCGHILQFYIQIIMTFHLSIIDNLCFIFFIINLDINFYFYLVK